MPRHSALAFPLASLLLLPAGLLLSACDEDAAWDCVKSTGHTATQRRDVGAFREVVAHENVDIELVPDSACFVEVTGGAHLLPEITTTLDGGGRLVIRNGNRCNWVRSYKRALMARVHFRPNYLKVTQEGSGRITSGVAARIDTLFLVQFGTGDIDLDVRCRYLWGQQYEFGDTRLRGTTETLVHELRGTGFLYAQDLTARVAYTRSYYDGVLRVRATDALGITLFGAADAYYFGTPARSDFRAESTGQVRRGGD